MIDEKQSRLLDDQIDEFMKDKQPASHKLTGGTCVVCGGTTIKLPLSEHEAEAMFRNEPIFRNLVERLARRLAEKSWLFEKEDIISAVRFYIYESVCGDTAEDLVNRWLKEHKNVR